MHYVFDLLDSAFDTLAHAFDGRHAPTTRRSSPQVLLFLLALALAACAVVLGLEASPWLLGGLGLAGAVGCAGLSAVWLR
jgi:4-hydroxybenzoate polyprenyltransferase